MTSDRRQNSPAMVNDARKDTPMMRQYQEAKQAHPGCVVLMRMGDFYEAFLEDAETLARVTGVALTSRDKTDSNRTAMAGVPHHQLKNYLPKLLAAGLRVAVMDQLEDPAVAKGIVRRGVTRVVSAGTLIDEDSLDGASANWLVAVTGLDGRQPIGIAALDLPTGRFQVDEARSDAELALILARLGPAELVLPDAVVREPTTAPTIGRLCAPAAPPPLAGLGAFAWSAGDARRFLADRLGVVSLDGFGIGPRDDHLCAAAAACLRYAEGAAQPIPSAAQPLPGLAEHALAASSQPRRPGLAHIRALVRINSDQHLVLDAACRRTLELTRNQRDGTRQATVVAAIDRTRTAPGARMLSEWLSRPLRDLDAIADRHDAVASLVQDDQRRERIRAALDEVYDGERLAARLATGRAGARDLVWLAAICHSAQVVAAALGDQLPALLIKAATALQPCPELAADISARVVDMPPLDVNDGGSVRSGVDAELDELRVLRADAGTWLSQYQAQEAAALGLPKLKVAHNSVFGYFIELSKGQAERAPAHFIRKQTLVNAERFITPELKAFEDKVTHAESRALAREHFILGQLRERAVTALPAIQAAAEALALIDVVAGLAELARRQGWTRPQLDQSHTITLRNARHPVVEAAIGRGRFVPNDTQLDAQHGPRLAIITGPNMAGKSTYIRQIALAVILAQAGSYVPAESARIGVADRVFTRIGSGDELARGMSTFMVEMAETAAILHHATAASVVVLDEVGRGTSTFDGLALAWAISEHLCDRTQCRTVFATHYHELTQLADTRPEVTNVRVAVAERDGEVAFLHRIEPGAATRSYGVHVAKLAGVPASVVQRATAVLAELESANRRMSPVEDESATVPHPASAMQTTLFGFIPSPVVERLKQLDLDELSPRQALTLLEDLQAQARRDP